ncbi:MAG TPA: NUDIX hydrolase [Cyclobacteriaceae bacterium]
MANDAHKNPWTTLSGEEKYDNNWITVTEYQVLNPSGGKGIYGKVHFKNKAIGIVALDEHLNIWLVGQYRYPLNEYSWEIPEGGAPYKESALDAAKRELREEAGITASTWSTLCRIHTSNSVTDEEGFIFLAEDLSHGDAELEETEADLKVWKLSLKEALDMVLTGKITDSLSMTGILMAARKKGL